MQKDLQKDTCNMSTFVFKTIKHHKYICVILCGHRDQCGEWTELMNLLTVVTYEEGSWFRSGEEKCAHQSIYFSMFECFTKKYSCVSCTIVEINGLFFFKVKATRNCREYMSMGCP